MVRYHVVRCFSTLVLWKFIFDVVQVIWVVREMFLNVSLVKVLFLMLLVVQVIWVIRNRLVRCFLTLLVSVFEKKSSLECLALGKFFFWCCWLCRSFESIFHCFTFWREIVNWNLESCQRSSLTKNEVWKKKTFEKNFQHILSLCCSGNFKNISKLNRHLSRVSRKSNFKSLLQNDLKAETKNLRIYLVQMTMRRGDDSTCRLSSPSWSDRCCHFCLHFFLKKGRKKTFQLKDNEGQKTQEIVNHFWQKKTYFCWTFAVQFRWNWLRLKILKDENVKDKFEILKQRQKWIVYPSLVKNYLQFDHSLLLQESPLYGRRSCGVRCWGAPNQGWRIVEGELSSSVRMFFQLK